MCRLRLEVIIHLSKFEKLKSRYNICLDRLALIFACSKNDATYFLFILANILVYLSVLFGFLVFCYTLRLRGIVSHLYLMRIYNRDCLVKKPLTL